MALYREKQNGIYIVVLVLLASCLPLLGIFTDGEIIVKNWTVMGLVYVLMILVAFLFFRLVTEVSSGSIKVHFGTGIIKKQISLDRVKEVKVVRNKWFYGWGIRFIINGWLWNIRGLDAIELTFKDKNSVFRIGSQEPEKLKDAIERQLKTE